MKKLIQSIMAIPIAERIGKAFGNKSFLGAGAEIVSARLVLRSFGAMLALGAVAGSLSWLAGKKDSSADDKSGKALPEAEATSRSKGKSRKAGKATAA